MKLCPKCELNYIADYEELCVVCKSSIITVKVNRQTHKAHPFVYFDEEFTFRKEQAIYRGKHGYKAYNSNDQNIGIVFMTDDKRTPAYECCELCIYPQYQNKYGKWHRFTSYGERLKWETLCHHLKSNLQYACHID